MPNLRRSLNLFNKANITSAATGATDDDHPEDWEAPWDTKAAILLSQGIVVTILVAIFIFVCGLKHYRRMHSMADQEFTIRIESQANRPRRGDASADNTGVQDEEQRTRLQKIMRLVSAPLRFVSSAVNGWASSPSTDFEYYDRILQRLEREKEARKESAEERTNRLMSAFAKKQCVWEIDEQHFIPPSSTRSIGSASESNHADDDSYAAIVDDVEIGSKAQVEKIYTEPNKGRGMPRFENDVFDTETIEIDATSDGQVVLEPETQKLEEVDSECTHISTILSDGHKITHAENGEHEKFAANSNESSLNTASAAENYSIQSDGNAKEPSPKLDSIRSLCKAPILTKSTSFDSSSPGYLYLNLDVSQNRMRSNSTGSSPTNIEPLSSTPDQQKTIPNQCAICLCDYSKGDKVIVSSNNSCPHAFHQGCIIEWLVKMQDGTPCPCCRQTFVELDNAEHVSDAEQGSRRHMSEEELGALRRHLQLGFQRGRAFNASVIRF